MTFNRQLLRELQQRLANSDSYPMTNQSVKFLLNSKLLDNDKNVIFDAINNDTARKNDPLSLRDWWNEKKIIPKLKF